MRKEKKITYVVDRELLDALESIAYLEPLLVGVIEGKRPGRDGKYRIRIAEYDVDDVLGAIKYQIQVEMITAKEKVCLQRLHRTIKG